mgnify:CR=1 FL=1
MIDGIDGSGKSTIVQTWKEHLAGQGNTIFDLKHYWQTNGKYPELDEMKNYNFIFSCEPTYTGMGKVIREELIKSNTNYPPRAIVEAFSLDRLILYKKIIIPLLNSGKAVIQDRGVSTSLAYQNISRSERDPDSPSGQNPEFTFAKISEFVGNNLALQNRPDYLVIAKIQADKALARLHERAEKKDDAIFEKLDFQTKAAAVFYSEEYQKIFTERGTKIHYLNTDAKIDIMKQEAVDLFKIMLNLNY